MGEPSRHLLHRTFQGQVILVALSILEVSKPETQKGRNSVENVSLLDLGEEDGFTLQNVQTLQDLEGRLTFKHSILTCCVGDYFSVTKGVQDPERRVKSLEKGRPQSWWTLVRETEQSLAQVSDERRTGQCKKRRGREKSLDIKRKRIETGSFITGSSVKYPIVFLDYTSNRHLSPFYPVAFFFVVIKFFRSLKVICVS